MVKFYKPTHGGIMAVGKLTGPKRAEVLLLVFGEKGAAEVRKNSGEAEIPQMGYFMTRLNDISSEELDQILEKFYKQSISDSGDLMAAPNFFKNALNVALGANKAKRLSGPMSASDQDCGIGCSAEHGTSDDLKLYSY
jgi:flagellar motor switch protein FliG